MTKIFVNVEEAESNKLRIGTIQFFADDDDNESDEDGNEDNDVENDALDDGDDFDDDVESAKSKDTSEKDKEKDKGKENPDDQDDGKNKKQSRKENELFAKYRRENEKAVQEAYKKGVLEAFNNVNKFTEEKIETEEDYQIFVKMLEAEKAGYDPLVDYYKYERDTMKKQRKEEVESKEKREANIQDFNDFIAKYPKIDIEELGNDARFNKFAKGKLGVEKLTTIYEDYLEFIDEFEKEATNKAYRIASKKIASPHVETSGGGGSDELYTLDQLKNMSDKELEKNWDKVEKSYAAIQKKR